ncbi:hypothetical protein [Phenylobacterium sp.]|uniref:hypothetical protein n=1 Tax=Phenylobacterium sp. TaxID=1871053 RepID=UPI002736B896|nr:hypothetical protein [Phenylobacterium sp.]MDP3855337.1 hypothetical protein [Phenylobacterium sp.]
MTKIANLSLADLDARKASEGAFEFEYLQPDGETSGVFFSVLGGQSKIVQDEANRLINERRRKEAVQAAQAKTSRNTETYTSVENDVEFGQRLAAVRVVGWRGIKETFSPELALALCRSNQDIASQVLERSNDMANFMKPSSSIS